MSNLVKTRNILPYLHDSKEHALEMKYPLMNNYICIYWSPPQSQKDIVITD